MSWSFHKALTERDLEMRSEARVGDTHLEPKTGKAEVWWYGGEGYLQTGMESEISVAKWQPPPPQKGGEIKINNIAEKREMHCKQRLFFHFPATQT